jgi:DNA-binding transcriptional ArsR family regulator
MPHRARRLRKVEHPKVWSALADPTRRAILDLLRGGPRTLGDIAAQFPTTRFSIRKHLNALEAAHLVLVRRQGRERWNHLNVTPLQDVYERWVTPYQQIWAGKLSSLRAHIEGESVVNAQATAATLERVELEIEIAASRERVWRALVDETTRWWPRDFYTGAAKGFHIEPKIGGRVYEDWGGGAGVLWYQVFAIHPGVSLDLHGAMGVPYGPAITLLHLELAVTAEGTMLKVSDSTIGVAGDRRARTEGWQRVFGEGLKAYVEATPAAPRGHR